MRKQKKGQEEFLGEESYFKPSEVGKSMSRRYDEPMYNSRLHMSNNMTIDDIEK